MRFIKKYRIMNIFSIIFLHFLYFFLFLVLKSHENGYKENK